MNGGRLVLDLNSKDMSASDSAEIDIRWTQAFILTGQADVNAPQGGIVQTLLPIKPDGDITLHFEGEGDADKWTAAGQLSDAGREALRFWGDAASNQIEAHIEIVPAASSLLTNIGDRLGEMVRADVTMNIAQLDQSDVSLDLRSDHLSARIYGPVDIEDRALAGTLAVIARTRDLSTLSGVPDLTAQMLSVSGELTQDKQDFRFAGDVSADKLAYGDTVTFGALLSRVDARYGDNKLATLIDLDASSPTFSTPQLNALVGDRLTLLGDFSMDVSDQSIKISQLDARGHTVRLTATGDLSPEEPFNLKGDLALKDLSRVTDQVTGSATLDWRVQRRSADAPIAANVKGRTKALKALDPTLRDLLGERLDFDATASIAPDGSANWNMAASSAGISVKSVGDYSDKGVDANIDAKLDAISVSGVSASSLALRASAKGPVDAVRINARSSLESVETGSVTLSDLALAFDGRRTDTGMAGDLALDGAANGEPISLRSLVDTSNGVGLETITASWADLKLTGDVSKPPGEDVTAEFALSGPIPLEDMTGDLDITGTLVGERIDVAGRIDELSTDTIALDDARFTIAGVPADLKITANAKGTQASGLRRVPLALALNADVKQEETARIITASLDGSYDREPVRTLSPLTLQLTDTGLEAETRLDILNGEIALTVERNSETSGLTAQLQATGIDIQRAAALAGRNDVKGNAAINAEWRGQADQGEGTVTIKLDGLERVTEGSPVMQIAINAATRDNQWALDLNLTGEDDLSITGNATVPLRVANGLPQFDAEQDAIAYAIDGKGHLGPLWTLVGIETVELDGDFELVARDDAIISAMRPTGRLTFENGEFEHAGIGVGLRDISLAADFNSQALTLDSVTARGVDGGSISGRGSMNLDQIGASSLYLDFKDFVAIKRNGQELQLAGRAKMEKTEKGAAITGELTAERALLDITTLTAGTQIPTVNVTFPDKEEKQATPEEEAPPERTFPVTIDLKLKAPNKAYIQGMGLDVEMSADIAVRGRMSDLALIGQANVVRGGFELAGQRFDFDKGSVNFKGKPKNALLDFEATRSSDGVTSYLRIGGTVTNPELILSSSPSLPEDEILARLLFGRSAAELSALEAAQLAAALATMTGGGGGLNPLGEIRNAVGLDRLTVSSNAEGNASVGAGRYLADDVYLEFRTSPGSVADIAVEWTPRDNIEIGTEFQQDGDARVTVQWKKDYGE